MPPELSVADVYVAKLCEEKHATDRADIAELKACYVAMEARLRAMELRMYAFVAALTVGGGVVGDALGKLFGA